MKAILNRAQKLKPFVYVAVQWAEQAGKPALEGDRQESWPISACGGSLPEDFRLAELQQYNLRSVRSYLLKEEFQFFCGYISPCWGGRFLDQWCIKTMQMQIEPIKNVARVLRRHRPVLLNWFRAKAQLSSGVVEGFNGKATEKILSRLMPVEESPQRKASAVIQVSLREVQFVESDDFS